MLKRKVPKNRLCISIILAIIFSHQQIGWCQDGHPVWEHARPYPGAYRNSIDIDNAKLSTDNIPYDIAVTHEVNVSDGDETIIHIQDAHASLAAQHSIANLLDSLVTNYDLRLVAFEGASGHVGTSILKSIPDKDIRKNTAEALMTEGRMGAGEFFAITACDERDIDFYGIEDETLYRANLESFRNIAKVRLKHAENINALLEQLELIEEAVFSRELLLLGRNSVLHREGNMNFTDYWKRVSVVADKCGARPARFSELSKLLESVKLERSIDFIKANTERKKLVDVLSEKLDKDELEALVLKSVEFKQNKISQGAFHTFLVNLAEKTGIPSAEYVNLITFTRYIVLYETVELFELYREVEAFEENLRAKLFRNGDEKELFRIGHMSRLLKQLYSMELTNDEYIYIKENYEKFSASKCASFIKKNSGKYRTQITGGYDLNMIFDGVEKALNFYRDVEARNGAMIKNTVKRMRTSGKRVAALITGGYHTKGLTELMKEKKLSYLVITPKFENGKERPYIAVLTNKRKEYQKLLESGKYQLAVEAFLPLLNIADSREFKEQVIKVTGEMILKYGEKRTREFFLEEWKKLQEEYYLKDVRYMTPEDIEFYLTPEEFKEFLDGLRFKKKGNKAIITDGEGEKEPVRGHRPYVLDDAYELAYLYENVHDPELFTKIDLTALSDTIRRQVEFDRNHYKWHADERVWCSKDFSRLILGTYDDIQEDTGSDHPEVAMKNHVAIRTKGGFTVYVFDNHQYSYPYIREAQERGEVPMRGNTQLFVDRHADNGLPPSAQILKDGKTVYTLNWPWIWKGEELSEWAGMSLSDCGRYTNEVLDIQTFNTIMAREGTVTELFHVEGPYDANEYWALCQEGIVNPRATDTANSLEEKKNGVYYPQEGRGRGRAFYGRELEGKVTGCFFLDYFGIETRPKDSSVIFNLDTDATPVGEEYTRFLAEVKKDNTAPSVALIATSQEDHLGIFGSVSMARRLTAKMLSLYAIDTVMEEYQKLFTDIYIEYRKWETGQPVSIGMDAKTKKLRSVFDERIQHLRAPPKLEVLFWIETLTYLQPASEDLRPLLVELARNMPDEISYGAITETAFGVLKRHGMPYDDVTASYYVLRSRFMDIVKQIVPLKLYSLTDDLQLTSEVEQEMARIKGEKWANGSNVLNYKYEPEQHDITLPNDAVMTIKNIPGRRTYEDEKRKGKLAAPKKQAVEKKAEKVRDTKKLTTEHDKKCRFSELSRQVLFACESEGEIYEAIANINQTGTDHVVLTTRKEENQLLDTTGKIKALLQFTRNLGEDFQGFYNSPGAAASVYHFHGQFMRGKANIWKNIKNGIVSVRWDNPYYMEFPDVKGGYLEGWPMHMRYLESTDLNSLARVVKMDADDLIEKDIPHNLAYIYDHQTGKYRVLIAPKNAITTQTLTPENKTINLVVGSFEVAGNFVTYDQNDLAYLTADPARTARNFIKVMHDEMSMPDWRSPLTLRALPAVEYGYGIVIGITGLTQQVIDKKIDRAKTGRIKLLALNEGSRDANLQKLQEVQKECRAYASGLLEGVHEDLQEAVGAVVDSIEKADGRNFLKNPEKTELTDEKTRKDIADVLEKAKKEEQMQELLQKVAARFIIIKPVRLADRSIYEYEYKIGRVAESNRVVGDELQLARNLANAKRAGKTIHASVRVENLGDLRELAVDYRKAVAQYGKENYTVKLHVRMASSKLRDTGIMEDKAALTKILERAGITDIVSADDIMVEEGANNASRIYEIVHEKYQVTSGDIVAIGDINNLMAGDEDAQRLIAENKMIFVKMENGIAAQLYAAIVELAANNSEVPRALLNDLKRHGLYFIFDPVKKINIKELIDEMKKYEKVLINA